MGVLGIDTSCYTTSVAYAQRGAEPVQARRILTVPEGKSGLQQSGALFQHVQNLPVMLEELRAKCPEMQIEAVCASTRPRDAQDSYMPVFLAGEGTARGIAASLQVPFFATSHQQGHVRAAILHSGIPEGDFMAVHLSGGTTELLHTGFDLHVDLLGGTEDLNAGQLVDRTGVALGLPFPCGPHLEELAKGGKAESKIPLSAKGMALHFSGAEAQIMRWVESGEMKKEDIAAEVYSYLSRAVAHLLTEGYKHTGCKNVLIAGGVSSSARFRTLLPERLRRKKCPVRVYWGKPEFSSDNAVGAALIGLDLFEGSREAK
ncbi:MAG: O-sialoglycoprotein endopeptidase [Clostridia bacterium]|nr:O-sialoglycoprotein endopeptidase [Clostridia bacterium]